MSNEEKEAKESIEYLKARLYGNEGCKYIDVSQEDLRIFINLVDRKEKDIEGWKKYCEEIEEEQTEMSNKNCELEFEVEKLQKENEELTISNKEIDKECSRLEEKEKSRNIEPVLINNKMYFIDKNLYEDLLNDIKSNYIPTQKIKDKIEELKKEGDYRTADNPYGRIHFMKEPCDYKIQVLKELLESEDSKDGEN